MAQLRLSGPNADDRGTTCHQQRWEPLDHLHVLIEKPLATLSLVWLALLVINLTVGLFGWLNVARYVIWAIFILDFIVEFLIAPHKRTYLKRHWLVAISLALPALAMLREQVARLSTQLTPSRCSHPPRRMGGRRLGLIPQRRNGNPAPPRSRMCELPHLPEWRAACILAANTARERPGYGGMIGEPLPRRRGT